MIFLHFLRDGVRELLHGPRSYWLWLGTLATLFLIGLLAYINQLWNGLVVTGMSDQVSWGFYLDGFDRLKVIIWSAVALNLVAVFILSIRPLRKRMFFLNIACVCGFIGIWLEKGMGFVIPGFIPTPLGEIFEYAPSLTEFLISIGIWALALMIFTLLAKASIAIELGKVRADNRQSVKRNMPLHGKTDGQTTDQTGGAVTEPAL